MQTNEESTSIAEVSRGNDVPIAAPCGQPAVQEMSVSHALRVQQNRCIHIIIMVLGGLNLGLGVWGFLGLDGWTILTGFAIGTPATLASVLYNPGGCCGEMPPPRQLKMAGILAAVAAAVCLVYALFSSMQLSSEVAWIHLDEFTCCPPGASEISDACEGESCISSDWDDGEISSCWAALTVNEPMTCEGDKVAIATGNTGREDDVAAAKSWWMGFTASALVMDTITALIAAFASYSTLKEAREVAQAESMVLHEPGR